MPRTSTVPERLRRRLVLRRIVLTILLLLGLTALLDHLGLFGRYRTSDWDRFDHRKALVTDVIDGDTVRLTIDGRDVESRLVGIDAPKLRSPGTGQPEHWADESKAYLLNRIGAKTVTIRLEQTQSRDRDSRLLAYLFLDNADNVNQDAIRDGQAYADMRTEHSLRPQFQQVEGEARKRKRGLWADLKEDQMPAWRLEWLRSRREIEK